jgi:outer membrane lipoprotein-sorting protein
VEQKRSSIPLLSATQQELVARIDAMAASVRTMNATVDIDTTVGGEKKGKVIEYQQIRGYILLEKPAMLRMIGLMPIVRNRAFDMVSDGDRFKLWIPPKNRFITGRNEVAKPSGNTLENLRPQVIYQSLTIPAIDSQTEIAVIEEGQQQVLDERTHKYTSQPNYHVLVIRKREGTWRLYRKIYFSRANLEPYRQTIFEENGDIATDVNYSDVQDFGGVRLPALIEISRPKDGEAHRQRTHRSGKVPDGNA